MAMRGTMVMPTEHGATLLHPRVGWGVLAAWLTMVAVAALGTAFAAGDVRSAYELVRRPGWALPMVWLDSAWAAWYVLTGVSTWLTIRRVGRTRTHALVRLLGLLTCTQLLWVLALFGLGWGGAASALAVVMCATSFVMLRVTNALHREAGWVLIPCVVWVVHVAILTGVLWHMNPKFL